MSTAHTTTKDTSVPDGIIVTPADTLKVIYAMAAMDYDESDAPAKVMLKEIGVQLYLDAQIESDKVKRLGTIMLIYEVSKLIDNFDLIEKTSNDILNSIDIQDAQEYLSVTDVSIFELSDQKEKFNQIFGFLHMAGVRDFEQIFEEMDAYRIELKAKFGGMKK